MKKNSTRLHKKRLRARATVSLGCPTIHSFQLSVLFPPPKRFCVCVCVLTSQREPITIVNDHSLQKDYNEVSPPHPKHHGSSSRHALVSLLCPHAWSEKLHLPESTPSRQIFPPTAPCSPLHLFQNLSAIGVGGRYFLSRPARISRPAVMTSRSGPSRQQPPSVPQTPRPISPIPAPPPGPRRQVLGAPFPGLARAPRA